MTSIESDQREPADGPESVVDSVSAILDGFSIARPALTLGDMVVASNLPKSTVHRLAEAMVAYGWLDRIGSQYTIGLRLFEFGSRRQPPVTAHQAGGRAATSPAGHSTEVFAFDQSTPDPGTQRGEAAMSDHLTYDGTAKTLTVGGYDLRYHEAGTGPTLLLLHGAGPGASAWSNFQHNLPVYAERFRTIMIDQPGFGKTGYPESYPSHYVVYTAKLIAELFDQLGIDKAHVLGNSLGGAVAVRFAMDFPERVDRLVLMGPGSALSLGLFAPRPSEGIRKLFAFHQPPGPSKEKMAEFLKALVYDESLITDELIAERFAAATDPAVRDGMKVMGEANRNPDFARDGELWREADSVHHDTLITWGAEDRVQPLDGAFVGFRRMPNARLYVFPKCGHWAQVERKAEFELITSSFLLGEL